MSASRAADARFNGLLLASIGVPVAVLTWIVAAHLLASDLQTFTIGTGLWLGSAVVSTAAAAAGVVIASIANIFVTPATPGRATVDQSADLRS